MSEQGASQESAPGEVPLSFDQWADLSARLLKRSERERGEILDHHGIEPEDWTRIDDHFNKALGDDINEGDGEGCRVAVRRRLRRRAGPPQGAEQDAPPVVPPEPPPAVAEPAPGGIVAPLQEAVPSYLRWPGEGLVQPVAAALRLSGEDPQTILASTMAALPRAPEGAATLPFGGAPSVEFMASLAAPARGAPPPAGGTTLPVGIDLMAEAKTALPFEKPPAAPAKRVTMRLTLEDYAAVCVELALYPDRSQEVMKRHHLPDEATMRAIDADWQRRLAAHPDTHQRWSELYAAYRDRLLRSR